jgi:RNA polymerase sigma-70 factor (ECF subfamily)
VRRLDFELPIFALISVDIEKRKKSSHHITLGGHSICCAHKKGIVLRAFQKCASGDINYLMRSVKPEEREMMAADEIHGTEQFMRLFLANQRRIYGLILTLVPNVADADDLLQEVSSRMWVKFDHFIPGTDFGAWGMQFARNVVSNFRRQRATAGVVAFNDELLARVADVAAGVIEQIDRRHDALRDCLRTISPRSRKLIERRYGPGEAVEAIAASIGQSASMVYKALSQIHLSLYQCIERKLKEAVE